MPGAKAAMKCWAKTVSYFCPGDAVDVMTMRPGAARASRKGKLALAVWTKTTVPFTPSSRPRQSSASRSGPTRLNFAATPS